MLLFRSTSLWPYCLTTNLSPSQLEAFGQFVEGSYNPSYRTPIFGANLLFKVWPLKILIGPPRFPRTLNGISWLVPLLTYSYIFKVRPSTSSPESSGRAVTLYGPLVAFSSTSPTIPSRNAQAIFSHQLQKLVSVVISKDYECLLSNFEAKVALLV